MLGKSSVRILGTREILQSMRQLPKEVNKRKEVLDPALVAGAILVRDSGRAIAPRDTGVLKRDIIAQRWRRPVDRMAATVVVRVRSLKARARARIQKRNLAKGRSLHHGDPFYWRFVEFGTSKMSARPFLRPAFDTKKLDAVLTAVSVARTKVQSVVHKLGMKGR